MLQDLKFGILGGGQLGAMLIRHAIDLGLNITVMDKDPEAPCARYTSSFYYGDPMDYDTVIAFGSQLDVITIEREAVNTEALRALGKQGVKVYPSPDTIAIIQDKYLQKQFLEDKGIPVAKGIAVSSRDDLRRHLDKLPGCLKKRSHGYDGNGVMMVRTEADVEKAFNEPSVLEEVVAIQSELSVIVARNPQGEIECYDPVEMIFDKERFLLDFQFCPANIGEEISVKAGKIAMDIAQALELTGIVAVEMFLTQDGRLLVNELAPRPHNSGHHTIEACATSQYEQLLRIISGLPLGNTTLNSSTVMINMIEPPAHQNNNADDALQALLRHQGVHVHWYGKKGGKEGRKMGHITITAPTGEEALSKAVTIKHLLKNVYGKKESSHHHGQQL